jgi:hypothetical protein
MADTNRPAATPHFLLDPRLKEKTLTAPLKNKWPDYLVTIAIRCFIGAILSSIISHWGQPQSHPPHRPIRPIGPIRPIPPKLVHTLPAQFFDLTLSNVNVTL